MAQRGLQAHQIQGQVKLKSRLLNLHCHRPHLIAVVDVAPFENQEHQRSLEEQKFAEDEPLLLLLLYQQRQQHSSQAVVLLLRHLLPLPSQVQLAGEAAVEVAVVELQPHQKDLKG